MYQYSYSEININKLYAAFFVCESRYINDEILHSNESQSQHVNIKKDLLANMRIILCNISKYK